MKYLKLDAEFEGARKLAECLIGNYCDKDKTYTLNSVFEWKKGWTFGCYDFEDKYFGFLQIIEIPIDNLKFCPFIAIKNKIDLKINNSDFGNLIGFWGGKFFFKSNQTEKFIDLIYINDMSLNLLQNLPCGCEIVEEDLK